jgi:hypothetical protein
MSASPARAQAVEIAPFAGYRFGGDFVEILTNTAQDVDGAPSFGITCNVPLHDGLSLEILYSRQSAHAVIPVAGGAPPARIAATSEYWHAGGLQELTGGAVRPFLTGTLGLTRMAAGGDAEVRFSVGAGSGVKLRASDHVALRLDGRVIVTFMDADLGTVICTTGRCVSGLHLWATWQADFTAGVVFML